MTNELYWLTRLDGLNDFILTFSIIAFILFVLFAITVFIGMSDTDTYNNVKDCEFYKFSKTWFPRTLLIASISLLAYVLIPTTKEMLIIKGVGGTIEYIKNNDTTKQLPDKTLQCIDKLLEDYLNNE